MPTASRGLALPDKNAPIPVGFADTVRAEVEQVEDFDVLNEYDARLAAWEEYVRARGEGVGEIRRARLYVEMRLGSLLPRESGGRGKKVTAAAVNLPQQRRSELRDLAENADIVEELLEDGVTARKEILRGIRTVRRQRETAQAKAADEDREAALADLGIDDTDVKRSLLATNAARRALQISTAFRSLSPEHVAQVFDADDFDRWFRMEQSITAWFDALRAARPARMRAVK